tara:strand:+ start:150 stop:731 length:582 start_codon:yes stop_codon:yes gene_type:complete
MNFRLSKLITTEKFQFVRIHKNANASVLKCIQNNFKKEEIFYLDCLEKKPRFCIIRDPYERFLSGLKWDLLINKVDIKDVDIKKLFTSNENHLRNSLTGHINHSISQILYLMNFQISHYVDIEDLNLFLKMHFKKSEYINNIKEEPEYNKYCSNVEKYLDKEEVLKYLHMDYHIYDSIKKSPFLWEWQHGEIF